LCSFLKLDTNRFLLMIKRTECLLPACLRACASVCIYVCCVCFFILSPGRALLTKEELCEPTVFSCVCFVSLSPQIALFFPPNLRSHCSLFFFWWWFVFFFFLGVSFCWLFVILLQVPNFNFRSRGQSRSRHRHPFPSLLLLIRNLPAGYRCSRAPRPK